MPTLVELPPLDNLIATSRLRRSLPDPPMRRYLRERAGLSQAEVAAVVGVTEGAVSRWESGQRTPRRALNVRYAELLDRLRREVLS